MEEQTAFETRPVLAPTSARRSRLALLVPAVALVGIAWAGFSGGRPDQVTAEAPDPSAAVAESLAESAAPVVLHPEYPSEVLGIDVQGLGDVRLARLDRGDVIAIAGWYVPLAIVDCPRLTPVYGAASPSIRPGFDPWAYCDRSGVLYASRPNVEARELAISTHEPRGDGPAAVPATVVVGVKLPLELERVGADPMPVVVLGHFVETSRACMLLGACPSELVVDYLGWAAGVERR